MHNKVWYVITALLISTLVLAACPASSSEPAQESAPAATEAPAETPTEAASEAVTTTTETVTETTGATEAVTETTETAPEGDGPTLTIWADDTRSPVLEEIGNAFEAEYGAQVVVTQKEFGSIRDDLKIAGPAGEGRHRQGPDHAQ